MDDIKSEVSSDFECEESDESLECQSEEQVVQCTCNCLTKKLLRACTLYVVLPTWYRGCVPLSNLCLPIS